VPKIALPCARIAASLPFVRDQLQMAHQPCTAHQARIARTTNKLPSFTNFGSVANRTTCHAPRRVSPSLSIWKEHLETKPAFLSLALAATLFSWAAPRQQSSAPSDRKVSSDSRLRRMITPK
jgi:hypothetical protein